MNKKTLGVATPVEFGFCEIAFEDELGESCAIQTVNDISHLLDESKPKSLILGLKTTHCYISQEYAKDVGIENKVDEKGFVSFDLPDEVLINSTMRLSEDQVSGLVVRLEQWLEKGHFSDEE